MQVATMMMPGGKRLWVVVVDRDKCRDVVFETTPNQEGGGGITPLTLSWEKVRKVITRCREFDYYNDRQDGFLLDAYNRVLRHGSAIKNSRRS